MGARHKCCAQIHHVAAVAERGAERRVEIGDSDEAVDRVPPASQMAKPARDQDGEAPVAVHVVGRPETFGRDRIDSIVKAGDHVPDRRARDGLFVFERHVNLDPAADAPEHALDGGVIARACDIAILHHQVKQTARRGRFDRSRGAGGNGTDPRLKTGLPAAPRHRQAERPKVH